MSEQATHERIERCPRCGTMLREVETSRLFTRHAGCPQCKILYVLWGTCISRCLTPVDCAGHAWKYLQDAPQTVHPKSRARQVQTQ